MKPLHLGVAAYFGTTVGVQMALRVIAAARCIVRLDEFRRNARRDVGVHCFGEVAAGIWLPKLTDDPTDLRRILPRRARLR